MSPNGVTANGVSHIELTVRDLGRSLHFYCEQLGLRVLQGLRLSAQSTTEGRPGMASSGKTKTTMAKLNREAKLRERRHEKKVRKDAKKRAAAEERAAQVESEKPDGAEVAGSPDPATTVAGKG